MTEPRTEAKPATIAGRTLLMAGLTFGSGRRLADYPELILAIEAEAAAPVAEDERAALLQWRDVARAAEAQVAALVEALQGPMNAPCGCTICGLPYDAETRTQSHRPKDACGMLSDLPAAANAHDADVARRAVEDALSVERLSETLLEAVESTHGPGKHPCGYIGMNGLTRRVGQCGVTDKVGHTAVVVQRWEKEPHEYVDPACSICSAAAALRAALEETKP